MKDELKIYQSYLKSSGGRVSRARDQVVKAFLNREGHIDGEGFYKELGLSGIKVGRATVFRTLKLLVDIGLARPLVHKDGVIYYEHSYNHAPHAHLICDCCGKVQEFSGAEVINLINIAGKAEGFDVLRYRVSFFGLCDDCSERDS